MDLLSIERKQYLISRNALFTGVSSSQLEELARYAKAKAYPARKIVCRQNEPGTQMFIIANGRVTLIAESDEGKEFAFGIMGEGDVFGEIAVFDGGPRTATVKTLEQTILIVIERRDFLPFLERNPLVAVQLLAKLASRLRQTDELFEDTHFRSLSARLAKRFLGLADAYGKQTMTGIEIGVKLSQGDISKLTGTTRESVNRQMKLWEEEGLISCQHGIITLHRLDRLQEFSAAIQ